MSPLMKLSRGQKRVEAARAVFGKEATLPFSFTRRGLFGLAAGAYAASRHTVRASTPEPATRRRLEAWVGRGGFVFRIDDPLKPDGARAGINPNLLVDVVASDCMYHM